MTRRSVRCAVIRTDAILMVQVSIDGRVWWTLPGGGVEPGERDEEAALRELQEETQMRGTVARWLCDLPEPCFLVEVDDGAEPRLDMDPQLADAGELIGVAWRKLSEVASDRQVRQVIRALSSLPGAVPVKSDDAP